MNIGSVMSPHGGGRKSTLAVEARALVQQARRGVLCSLIPEGGFPYGSLVEVLPLPDGDLIIFLSRLAEHQHYIEADAGASILVAPHIADEHALAKPRASPWWAGSSRLRTGPPWLLLMSSFIPILQVTSTSPTSNSTV